MKKVFKYPLPWPPETDCFNLMLPGDAQILKVENLNGAPCIWALVDPDAFYAHMRRFRVAGTGHPIEEALYGDGYIGTFFQENEWGTLVWHLFEVQA